MLSKISSNVNQQQRIEQGLQSGALSTGEAGQLERGRMNADRSEANAAHDGYVGGFEQRRIQHAENRQSRRIFSQNHNARTKA